MKFEELESMWKLPPNQLSLEAVDEGRRAFLADQRRVRRNRAIRKVAGLVFLSLLISIAASRVFGPIPHGRDVGVRAWGTGLAMLLPWVLSGYLTPWLRRREARLAAAPTISAGLQARLADNGAMRRLARWGAIGLATVVAATPLLLHQLDAAGLVRDGIVVRAFLICPALLLAVGAGALWYDRRRLLPRKRELESLLAEHRTEG